MLPTYLSYDSHWPVRKVPTKSTPHFVSYHPEAKVSHFHGYDNVTCSSVKVHAVIVSEDKICKVVPKMSPTGDEVITLDSVERGCYTATLQHYNVLLTTAHIDDRFVSPTMEMYSLQLYSPTVWEPVPNSK